MRAGDHGQGAERQIVCPAGQSILPGSRDKGGPGVCVPDAKAQQQQQLLDQQKQQELKNQQLQKEKDKALQEQLERHQKFLEEQKAKAPPDPNDCGDGRRKDNPTGRCLCPGGLTFLSGSCVRVTPGKEQNGQVVCPAGQSIQPGSRHRGGPGVCVPDAKAQQQQQLIDQQKQQQLLQQQQQQQKQLQEQQQYQENLKKLQQQQEQDKARKDEIERQKAQEKALQLRQQLNQQQQLQQQQKAAEEGKKQQQLLQQQQQQKLQQQQLQQQQKAKADAEAKKQQLQQQQKAKAAAAAKAKVAAAKKKAAADAKKKKQQQLEKLQKLKQQQQQGNPVGQQAPPRSDIRLKRDVVPLASLANGIKLYRFRYLWSETVQVGVMAQDLLREPARRGAVILQDDGFYAVDYASLGLRMATFAEWQARVRPPCSSMPRKAKSGRCRWGFRAAGLSRIGDGSSASNLKITVQRSTAARPSCPIGCRRTGLCPSFARFSWQEK